MLVRFYGLLLTLGSFYVLIVFMYVGIWTCEYWYPQNPKEGVESSGSIVIVSYEPPYVDVGTKLR